MKAQDICGENKERDLLIIDDYLTGLSSMKELSLKYNLTQTRIHQIVANNYKVIMLDKSLEKLHRILWLKKQIILRGKSNRDSLDLLRELRIELEGEKPLIENNEYNFSSVWNNCLEKVDQIDEQGRVIEPKAKSHDESRGIPQADTSD